MTASATCPASPVGWPRWPSSASTPIWLSPFYRSAAGRRRLRRRRLPRRRPGLRHPGRLRRDAGSGPTTWACKVIVDLVPNHSSDEHAWFRQALAAAAGSPERAATSSATVGASTASCRRTTGQSVFGGPAWTRTTDPDGTPGQWYLHLFDTKQPDWNWENPEVRAEFLRRAAVLAGPRRRRVPGRRGPRADQGARPAGLRPASERRRTPTTPRGYFHTGPMWDQDGVHEVYRDWRGPARRPTPPPGSCAPRRGCSRCPGWPATSARTRCTRRSTSTTWRASGTPRGLRDGHRRLAGRQRRRSARPTTWVLSNHDVVRHVSRLGLPTGRPAAERHRRR